MRTHFVADDCRDGKVSSLDEIDARNGRRGVLPNTSNEAGAQPECGPGASLNTPTASNDEQELYDATTILLAALTFTHCTEDLVKPELNAAIERVIVARSRLRRAGRVTHLDAALIGDAPCA